MLLISALALAKPSAEPVTFVGIDYSLATFYGTEDFRDVEKVTGTFPGVWNRLWADAMMEDLAKAAGPVTQDVSIVEANNATVSADQIIRKDVGDDYLNDSDITRGTLAGLVEGYDLKGTEGLALVLVVDRYVRLMERGCTWVVYFDAGRRNVLASERVCGRAGGYGFRNYWFTTAKRLMNDIRRLKPKGHRDVVL